MKILSNHLASLPLRSWLLGDLTICFQITYTHWNFVSRKRFSIKMLTMNLQIALDHLVSSSQRKFPHPCNWRFISCTSKRNITYSRFLSAKVCIRCQSVCYDGFVLVAQGTVYDAVKHHIFLGSTRLWRNTAQWILSGGISRRKSSYVLNSVTRFKFWWILAPLH